MRQQPDGNTWNVVLAAGEGTRMGPLVRLLNGSDVPKQYVAIGAERTMLQATLDRIAPLAPPERTVVVVAEEREALARRQLAGFAGVDIAAQPRNAGTAPGVLFPLARILARDPAARVVVFPADHHVSRPAALVDASRQLLEVADAVPSGLALIGVPARRPDPGLGYLVPDGRVGPDGEGHTPGREIARFVEKPAESLAFHLVRIGALWNTFVFGGRGSALWDVASRHVPAQAAALFPYLARVASVGAVAAQTLIAAVYRDIATADFSRDVLERASGVGVVTMIDAGWSDFGTPERVLAELEGTPDGDRLLARIFDGSRAPVRRSPSGVDTRLAAVG